MKPGLYEKFHVVRTDGTSASGGKHHNCDYFVLDTTHDRHAATALTAYADSVEAEHPQLAASMRLRWKLVRGSPIDMVLYCPACGNQHIDAPDTEPHAHSGGREPMWTNPPHKSHLCHNCNHIWRPADVPTSGVADTKTHGKNDSPKGNP